MIDLRAVETLRRVAALGSFSAAAAELHLTQPAVSRQVALLERRLGTRLALRSRRGVRLTPAGRLVVSHADAIHARLGHLEAELGALRGGGRVTLRLGAHSTAFVRLVPWLVDRLRERHPAAQPTLEQHPRDAALAGVRAGELDAALCFAHAEAPSEAPELELVELGWEPMLLFLPRDDPRAALPAVPLASLAGERWIAGSPPAASRVVVQACRAAGFEPRIEHRTDDQLVGQSLVALGLGVSLAPALGIGPVREDVVARPLDPAPRRRLELAVSPWRTPAADLALELAHEAAATLLR